METLLVAALVTLIGFYFYSKRTSNCRSSDGTWPYVGKRPLSSVERNVHSLLSETFVGYPIITKPQLRDLVSVRKTQDGCDWNRVLDGKRVDFVICDRRYHAIAAIDVIDYIGRSYDDKDDAEARIKEKVLVSAGIKFLRLNAKTLPDAQTLRSMVPSARTASIDSISEIGSQSPIPSRRM